jgi:lysophospholipase L1-like esterase
MIIRVASKFIRRAAVVLIAFTAGAMIATDAQPAHWVGTWGCGPQLTEPGNLPPMPLANSTLRQFVHVTIGGNHLRVLFSNAYGTNSVMMNSVHVALASGAGSGGSGTINTATDKALAFHGSLAAVIPPGEAIWSDPLEFNLPALTNLAITIYFGNISATAITGHPGSRTTSFIIASNFVSAASLPDAKKTAHWHIITGVDVLADASGKAVVALGDSITDGRGSTTDGNNRWPDDLAARLLANSTTTNVAVINMGIGGNGVFGGLGPSANARFDRDVLNQSGVRWLIIFEGVNDIGGARGERVVTLATNLIAAYTQFADKAHAKNLRVYGATVTPFGGNGYFSVEHEAIRKRINAWIRTNSIYDGVIDFDAAVRDPADPAKLKAEYFPGLNANDGLHLNPAGYRAMADAIDLNLFTQ